MVVCGGEFKLGNNGGQERGDCTESTVGRENLPWHGTAWHGSGTTGTPAALSPAPCAEPPMWGDAKSRESSFTPSLFPVLPWALVGLRMGLGHGGPAKPFTPRANATAGGGGHTLWASRGLCVLPGPLLQPQCLHNQQTFRQWGGEWLSRGGGRQWMRVVQLLRGRTGAAAQDGGFTVLMKSRGRAGDREGGWEHVVSKTQPKTWPGIGYLSRDGAGEAGEGLGTAGHGSNPVPIPAWQQRGLAGHFSLVSCSPGCSLPASPCPHLPARTPTTQPRLGGAHTGTKVTLGGNGLQQNQ